ncbi:hypothetical protein AMECASPLE_019540 [Ameca splendens]|uniref:Uncharacterized protein n=1 Tax=Ameca splendens TaxID=208324 RepID=A0ABV1A9X0_9TELE
MRENLKNKIKLLWLLPVALQPFAEINIPGQKQARRNVLAVSITLVYTLITPLLRTARTVVQAQDCRCAAAVLMSEKQPNVIGKLAISLVAPAQKTKTDKQKKTDDEKQSVCSRQVPVWGCSCGGRAVAQQRARLRDL